MRHTLVIVDFGWSSDVGLLTVADVASLAAYCQAYGHWRTAEEVLARMADRDEHMHGLLIKTVDGNPRRNPLVKVAADAAEDMLRFAGEFGLTPVARTRLAQVATPNHHRHRSSRGCCVERGSLAAPIIYCVGRCPL